MAQFKDCPFITSPQNEKVKQWVELRKDGNVRRDRKLFFMEGRRAVATALEQAPKSITDLIFTELILDDLSLVEKAGELGVPMTRVSKDVFKKVADVMEPQGIAAVVKMPDWTLDDVLKKSDPILLVACGLQDPGNLGTLIRSCEASGATGLIALENTADPYNSKVVRSTAGTLLTLPIIRMSAGAFLKEAEKYKIRLVAAAAHEGKTHRKFDWKKRPIALCIGSEGEGLPAEIEKAATEKVHIGVKGKAESLNAAVAGSILLFEAQAE